MNTRLTGWIGSALAMLLTVSAVLSQAPSERTTTYQELPNFHQVNEHLYRGAQPKADGFRRLAQLGVRTVVNLREDDDLANKEEAEARAAGLRYFNLPMKTTGRPADEQVAKTLAILDNVENQPVFVHCHHGEDRTGLIVAIYRIVHDGWTSERAKAEANHFGMHPWETGMKDYIHDFYQRRQTPKTERAPEPAGPDAAGKKPNRVTAQRDLNFAKDVRPIYRR
jgi:tyrosine-protein phosphatase SIW14